MAAYGKGTQLGKDGSLRFLHSLVFEGVFREQLFATAMDHSASYVFCGRNAEAVLAGDKKVRSSNYGSNFILHVCFAIWRVLFVFEF
ncbi:unnamed protein product [Soboliphyme baturini]|uniref:Acyl-CoA_dh_1 domain-containing protein n=1 Tax=Soboliphyme baturini TaxID=241478 RepID=A0A183JAF4_9BILA|nr:unnamed protein product [Soboliphyme baturini]